MVRARAPWATTLLAACAVAAGACADDYQSLLVLHNQAPDDECKIAPEPSDPYIPHGTAELAAGGYTLTPLLQSSLIGRADMNNVNIIALRRATVEIEPVDNDASRDAVAALGDLRGATRFISGVVDPGGLTSTSFDAIDDAQAAAFRTVVSEGLTAEILAKVVVYGEVAGQEVASSAFYYPITLVNRNGGFIDRGACAALPPGFVGEILIGCFRTLQDGGVGECCTSGTRILCPARRP